MSMRGPYTMMVFYTVNPVSNFNVDQREISFWSDPIGILGTAAFGKSDRNNIHAHNTRFDGSVSLRDRPLQIKGQGFSNLITRYLDLNLL